MLYACDQRFDVTENLENFCQLNKASSWSCPPFGVLYLIMELQRNYISVSHSLLKPPYYILPRPAYLMDAYT